MVGLNLFDLKAKRLEEYPTMKYGAISKQASGSTQFSILKEAKKNSPK
jgi:hypothetical protein